MYLRHAVRRAGAILLLPVFLLGSVLCTCVAATAAPPAGHENHDCCPGGEDQAPKGHDEGCKHCGQVLSAETASVKVPAPASLEVSLPAAAVIGSPVVELTSHAGYCPGWTAAYISPRSIVRLKCALLI
jgi:hypothetical protein